MAYSTSAGKGTFPVPARCSQQFETKKSLRRRKLGWGRSGFSITITGARTTVSVQASVLGYTRLIGEKLRAQAVKGEKTMNQEEWDKIFSGCPGAWYGNQPDPEGNITLDSDYIPQATRYLLCCGLCIISTHAPPDDINISDEITIRGITIEFREGEK